MLQNHPADCQGITPEIRRPYLVTAGPSTGKIPMDCLILNVRQRSLKRHAGRYARETVIGTTGGKIGFYGATPVTQPAGDSQAAVTLANTDGVIDGLTISNPPPQVEVQVLRDMCEELAFVDRPVHYSHRALCGLLWATPGLDNDRFSSRMASCLDLS